MDFSFVKRENKITLFALAALFAFLVSALSSFRDFGVGADTVNYVRYFFRVMDQGGNNFEVGFYFFTALISNITDSPRVYLFFVSFFVTSSLYYVFSKFIVSSQSCWDNVTYIFLFYALILFSSWYFVAFANGFRQGMSLSVLYISLFFLFYEKKLFRALFLIVISLSFHLTSVLVLPFLFIYFLSFQLASLVWLFFAIFYIFGLNEIMVKMVSDFFSLGVYEAIKYYSIDTAAVGSGKYEGLDYRMLAYTMAWPILFFIISKSKSRNVSQKPTYVALTIKIYMVLSIPYFVFGFGPFANRYAFIAWLFVPLIQSSILIACFDFRRAGSFLIVYSTFLVSFAFFLFYRLEMWVLFV